MAHFSSSLIALRTPRLHESLWIRTPQHDIKLEVASPSDSRAEYRIGIFKFVPSAANRHAASSSASRSTGFTSQSAAAVRARASLIMPPVLDDASDSGRQS
jgi:hypothetical protein